MQGGGRVPVLESRAMMSSSTLSLDRYAYGAPALLSLLKSRVLQSPATDPVPSLKEVGFRV